MTAPALPALKALLARVEAATGPDCELDGDIAEAFGFVPHGYKRHIISDPLDGVYFYWDGEGAPDTYHPEPWSSYTDAALAFFEAVLPGWGWTKYSDGSVAVGFYGKWFDQGDPLANLALTIIAATLKALIEKETDSALKDQGHE